MSSYGTFNLASGSFSSPGYVSGFSGLSASQVCSTATLFGVAGSANCTTSPSISIAGDLSWGTATTASTKTLTFTLGSAGTNYAKLAFTGPGRSGFKLNSVGGVSIETAINSVTDQIIALDSNSKTSRTVVITPIQDNSTSEKTMTLTVSDATGTTQAISGDVTLSDTIANIGSILARFVAYDSAVTSVASTSGTELCNWPDISGNGYHATGTTGSCPKAVSGTYASGTIPSVRFYDGTTRYLTVSTLSLSKPFTVVSVFKYRGVQAGRTVGTVTGNWLAGGYGGAWLSFYAGDTRGWVNTQTAMAVGTRYATIAIDSGSNTYYYVNGVDKTNGTPGTGENPGSLMLGRSGVYGENGDYDMAEVVIFSKALDSTERTAVFDRASSIY